MSIYNFLTKKWHGNINVLENSVYNSIVLYRSYRRFNNIVYLIKADIIITSYSKLVFYYLRI